MKKLALLLALISAPGIASAEGTAVSGKLGTLGWGIEITQGFSDSLGGRIGLNKFTYKMNTTNNAVNYDLKLQLQTVEAMADYYPFQGSFRTTAGLMYNSNKGTFDAVPTGGSYTINGQTFLATNVGSLQGSMTFNKVAPYLGIGWGNPAAKGKGFGMATDFGILFQGRPTASLTTTSTDPNVQAAVAVEQVTFQDSVNGFKYYPVMSIALTYQW
jgi:hypothetical protein